MRRMESGDEPEFVQKLRDCRKISPLATNERPLTCNCSVHLSSVTEDVVYPHAHSKSEADITDIIPYAAKVTSPPIPIASARNSFEEEYQLPSSAPAALMSGEFYMNSRNKKDSLKPSSASNSPTASTLQLCQALEEPSCSGLTRNKHAVNNRDFKPLKQGLPSAQSAPVIVDLANPFKFPALYSFKQFDPIAENCATNTTFSPNIPSTPAITINDTNYTHSEIPPSMSSSLPHQHFNAYHHPLHNSNPLTLHHRHPHHDHSYQHLHLQHHHNVHHNNNSQHQHNNHQHHHYYHDIPNVVVTYNNSPTSSSNFNDLLPFKTNDFDEFNTNFTSISGANSSIHNQNHQHQNQNHNQNTPCFNNNNKSFRSQTLNDSFDKPFNTSSIIKPTLANTTTDNTVTSTSSSSSVSSRRQRHGIAGQMSYMKMLGFGGFSKKMTTSSNSLFSTAVITGSSSAPNLRDMIPVSSSVLDGFGGVPPIRPLETLHNALSLKQLDHFLEKMTSAPLFKTPTCTPPKNPSTPLSMMTTTTLEEEPLASTPTNHVCRCNDNTVVNEKNPDRCSLCGYQLRPTMPGAASTPITPVVEASGTLAKSTTTDNVGGGVPLLWSKQSSVASSITEPSSPAISDTCSQETPSCDMSISLTSTDGCNLPSTAAQRLAKFFPRLDDDLNSVSIYAPINLDCLEGGDSELNYAGAVGGLGEGSFDAKSACLTPVSFNMDLSIVANKGSLTLSVDGFDDDDDATPSAATTPSLPCDEPHLELCYCCETHSNQGQPPDDTQKSNELFNIMRNKRLAANDRNKQQCFCHDATLSSGGLLNAETPTVSIRKASDTISPRIQKQISLFESGELERQKEYSALHASINIPQPNSLQLKQDARLRKFENLTQSTSNSNFPFESNTLKRVPNNVEDFVDANLTQSCINLKTSGVNASNTSSTNSSPQHKAISVFRPVTQSFTTIPAEEVDTTSGPASPHPGALIVKEKFIEPPKRITRSFHGKTQSMDADFLFNEFLLVPSHTLANQNSSSSDTGSAATSPSARCNKRFTTTKVLDKDLEDLSEH